MGDMDILCMVDVVTVFIIAFPRNGINHITRKEKERSSRIDRYKKTTADVPGCTMSYARANEAIHYI